ncbi:GlsB/YeaQ/YmgE family stress response membrane protein [Sphingosinicella sp.]|uniref:GlsB/YeaQ/YmgE family stress response membrane protein n=1 Tax=Sphingosinicella sp. TaxID=1917971 RepID=UPI0040381865
MTTESLVIFIVVGVVAGFLAGVVVRGYGLGLVGNLVVGVVGAFLAGWLLPRVGVAFTVVNPLVTAIVYATIGAVVLLLLIGLVRRST